MHLTDYGPFANTVAIAAALMATFAVLMLKTLGRITRWTWLTANTPPFIVTAGARGLAIAVMAATFITIDPANYRWYSLGAVAAGTLMLIAIVRFDRMRRSYVVTIQEVAEDGRPLVDEKGNALVRSVVIGRERDLNPEASSAYREARARHGISLPKFMSGYGDPVNEPENLWDREYLAARANRLMMMLIFVVLLGVLTTFHAAIAVEAHLRPPNGAPAAIPDASQANGEPGQGSPGAPSGTELSSTPEKGAEPPQQ